MQSLEVVHDSPLPPSRVYAVLSEHERLGSLLGATVTRVRDGRTSRDGAGSARSVRVWPLPAFEEEVVATEPDASIDYRISRGSPLRGHRGRVALAPLGTGCRVTWTVSFDTAVPLLGPLIRLGLRDRLAAGLRAMDRAERA